MQSKMNKTQIIIVVGDKEFEAELYDNPTANSLIEQMPFSIDLKDYANKEKIFYPEQKLSLKLAPKGYDPQIGDITYYGPWGNVAIFYEDHGYADGLIPLGHIYNIKAMINAIESINGNVVFKVKQ